jgi:hypothetical protein
MTYQLIRRQVDFCRCALEAWVLVGVSCDRRTFYGDDGQTVRAQAIQWVKQQFARAAFVDLIPAQSPSGTRA